MLTTTHSQAYSQFLQTLHSLRDHLHAETTFSIQELQQVFQQQVSPLSTNELDSAIVSRWQSLHTEVYRAMRLLPTEVMLWQASRQSTTAQQRKQAVRDRISQLINLCNAILEL